MEQKKNEEDFNYIDILKEAQEKLDHVVLPSMGLLENEVKVEIQGREFLKNKKDGKEN